MKFGLRIVVFLVLVGIPILEIALLVKLGQWVGVLPTVLLVLSTAAFGSYVLHRQGFKVFNRVMESINAGKPPVGPAIDGAFIMLAGGLLIAPGILTDLMGLLLLIPPLRHAVAAWSVRRFLRSAVVRTETFTQRTYNAHASQQQAWPGGPHVEPAANEDGPVIDGEFERIDERTVDARKQPSSHRPQANGSTHPGERPGRRA